MKAILAAMNTTILVVKIRPELFSVLIFTASSVVFVSARIVFIFVSSTAVHIYMTFLYLQSFIL